MCICNFLNLRKEKLRKNFGIYIRIFCKNVKIEMLKYSVNFCIFIKYKVRINIRDTSNNELANFFHSVFQTK